MKSMALNDYNNLCYFLKNQKQIMEPDNKRFAVVLSQSTNLCSTCIYKFKRFYFATCVRRLVQKTTGMCFFHMSFFCWGRGILIKY